MGTLLSALLSFLRAARARRGRPWPWRTLPCASNSRSTRRNQKHARLRAGDRVFWVVLRRLWSAWDRSLIVVRPETVIAWHRQGFRLFWRRRSTSRKVGRPRIPREHIAFIRRISGDHPEWGEDKIAEEFDCQVRNPPFREHDPALHGPAHRWPRKTQTWHTFIQNHAKEVWACDFLTQYTAFFAVAYVFVIMEIGSRRIVHVNVTTNPTLPWVKQQIREATAWGQTPRFLVHDNDGIFGQFGRSGERGAGRKDAQLPLPSGPLAARGHGDRGTADPVRSTERIAARRALHADAAAGGAGPLHLPQRRSHPPRGHGVRPLLQRGPAIAGDPRDPGSVPGTEAASAGRGTARGSACPRWGPHDYRLAA